MAISVKNITKLYGEQKALNNVSFEIKPGEIVGFLGPNGAGKSTMMKIITCFLPQTEGEVSVCGFDVVESPLEVKKVVGYLPEHNPLYLEMYVREYLLFVAGIHQLQNPKERVEEMIDLVGLRLEAAKKLGALSKGYRQRVGLAQALIHDPQVLILDEPTTGLDPNQIVEIRNLIRTIGKKKMVMMSTHIMQEVEAICDRVLIINRGEIVADESASEIKSLNKGVVAVVVEFTDTVDIDKLRAIEGVQSVEEIGRNTYKIAASNAGIQKQVFNTAVEFGWEVLTLKREEKQLEDIFKTLTKS